MGMQRETVQTGISPAVGFSNQLIKGLGDLLGGGFNPGFGGRPINANNGPERTGTIMDLLGGFLSKGAGDTGHALQQIAQKETDRQVGAVRSRFGARGGTSRGTPAAVAESLVRSEAAPRITREIGGIQLQALGQLFPLLSGIAGRGLPQREDTIIQRENPIISGLGAVAGLAQGAGSLASGGLFNSANSVINTLMNPRLGHILRTSF